MDHSTDLALSLPLLRAIIVGTFKLHGSFPSDVTFCSFDLHCFFETLEGHGSFCRVGILIRFDSL
jgi:hypothetical protein